MAAAYGTVIVLTGLLGAGGGGLGPFVAALAAAFVLAPARGRIQRGVNRLLYGQRNEPYAVVSRVASELTAAGSAEQLLPALASAIATALRVPYVGVELQAPQAREIIAHGEPPAEVTRIPLVHQGRTTGALIVGHRPGQREVPRRERALLADLASQAAVAAANVLLTEDLRRSLERIVTTREEERRRLRNDLHDGLGPQLTGVALGLDLVAEGAQAVAPEAAATRNGCGPRSRTPSLMSAAWCRGSAHPGSTKWVSAERCTRWSHGLGAAGCSSPPISPRHPRPFPPPSRSPSTASPPRPSPTPCATPGPDSLAPAAGRRGVGWTADELAAADEVLGEPHRDPLEPRPLRPGPEARVHLDTPHQDVPGYFHL